MSDAPPLLALLSMVPKWNRHWLNTAPLEDVPLFELVPPLLVVPPAEVPPLLVEPPDEVPPDEDPPVEVPPLPPVVATLEDVLVEPPVADFPATALELEEPPEAPAELLLVEDEEPPEATTLELWPPCPAFPLVEDEPPLPPEGLESVVLPPEPPPWSLLSGAQANMETAAAIERRFFTVEERLAKARYITARLTCLSCGFHLGPATKFDLDAVQPKKLTGLPTQGEEQADIVPAQRLCPKDGRNKAGGRSCAGALAKAPDSQVLFGPNVVPPRQVSGSSLPRTSTQPATCSRRPSTIGWWNGSTSLDRWQPASPGASIVDTYSTKPLRRFL